MHSVNICCKWLASIFSRLIILSFCIFFSFSDKNTECRCNSSLVSVSGIPGFKLGVGVLCPASRDNTLEAVQRWTGRAALSTITSGGHLVLSSLTAPLNEPLNGKGSLTDRLLARVRACQIRSLIKLSEVAEYCWSNCEWPCWPDQQLKGRLDVALQGH